MSLFQKNTLISLFHYIFAAVLSLILFALVTHAWRLSAELPFYYSWDSIFESTWIKSIIDTGWFMNNPYIGAPNGYNLADFPLSTNRLFFLIIKLLSYLTHSYAKIFNVFFILPFPIITLSTLFVSKRLGLNYPFALASSLLFTYLPYHFFRGAEGHLFLSSYYMIPLTIWLAVLIGTNQFQRWRAATLIGILLGATGIYYAFFSIFLLFSAGLISSVNYKKLLPLYQALILIGVIALSVIANLAPEILYKMQYGGNAEVAARAPFESELYGLKITQLLLPVDHDRVPVLAALKDSYNHSSMFVTSEGNFASLGLIGGIGFLTLLLIILFGIRMSKTIDVMSKLNLAAVLLATTGGLGTLFAYTLSPMIRCYARISVFIAFLSIFTVFYLIQKLTEKYNFSKSKIFIWILITAIILFGMFNQIGKSNAAVQNLTTVANYNNDENFVRAIENKMPAGSMIYQLPYLFFPEHGPLVNMLDYEQFRPYLHSHTLKWSYGSMRNRPVATWQEKTSCLPVSDMIKEISYAGFTGIYLDRNGYVDHGLAIEKQIAAVINEVPLISPDSNFSFFDIRSYITTLKNSESSTEWNQHVDLLHSQLTLSLDWGKGFYDLETGNNKTWHWSQTQSTLHLINYNKNPIRIKISFTLVSSSPTPADLEIKGSLIHEKLKINDAGTRFSQMMNIPPGNQTLSFISNTPKVFAPGDARSLFFRVEDLQWEIV